LLGLNHTVTKISKLINKVLFPLHL
jgi:hypothetical protein